MHDHHESFWTKYIFSRDHKVIALQYTITALLVGLFALALSWVMRLQLGFPGTFQFINPGSYYQIMTQHGMIMIVYLLTAILLGGFGNYLIPLMIGARDMAFPFLNMLSFWVYLLSVIVLIAAFVVPGGPTGAGWTLYPPLSALPNAAPGSGWGIKLMLISLVIFIASATMGGLNYVTTVLQCRTKGMTLMRMPLSVWGIFIGAVMALFAFPALFVGGVMLLFDNLLGTSFFIPTVTLFGQQLPREGGNPLLFQHLFWYFGHPEVYVVILPAMGIVSDLIATHARKPIFGYKAMVIAMAAIALIGFLVWAHHMFVSGMNPYFGFFFAVSTLIIAIPSAVKVYNWLLTLWRGKIRFTTPMLFGLGWISTFIIGGLTGLPLGNVVADIPLHDTYFVVGHFHLVMGVAALMAIFGGIYHWFPKVTGRMFNETLGKIHFWVTFIGAYMIFFPMLLLGILGVPRRYFDFTVLQYLPWQTQGLNAFITITALIVGAAQVIFLANLIWSAVRGQRAEPNPWQATTLEWQTPTTPPPHGNWGAETPTVYRWAYDYSVPGEERDFIPQNVPATQTTPARTMHTIR
ncbi:MAG: cbb3-type cytochrome c oxidase subunit I [Candidatus Bipolaricaulota bacterium]|nr:cbb3-type cytochrome c oxidase subunit I [Candidatus Bipolaricaulota bacterium]MDW8031634.1 cbb3-type cytochrome c oxidase subunit I [Candidatus Bipolaricaulota bacterium]